MQTPEQLIAQANSMPLEECRDVARSLGTEHLLAMARSMTISELRDAVSGGILDLNAAIERPGEMLLCGDYEWSLIDILNTKQLEAERHGQLAPA